MEPFHPRSSLINENSINEKENDKQNLIHRVNTNQEITKKVKEKQTNAGQKGRRNKRSLYDKL